MIKILLPTFQVLVSKPQDFAVCTTQTISFGEVSIAQNSFHELQRVPFSRLTTLRMSAIQTTEEVLMEAVQIPSFRFVQDVEEEADVQNHTTCQDLNTLGSILPPPDILWFFQVRITFRILAKHF